MHIQNLKQAFSWGNSRINQRVLRLFIKLYSKSHGQILYTEKSMFLGANLMVQLLMLCK